MTKQEDEEQRPTDLSELGRRLAAARRTVEGVCPVCGRTFTGPANKKYDRRGCAVTASRRRGRADRNGTAILS
jgi:hypothetical protein